MMELAEATRRNGEPRWRGEPGRLEVWYATLTDSATGAGCWIHAETVAPLDGDAYSHGWLSWFPAVGSPTTSRFGRVPAAIPGRVSSESDADDLWFDAAECRVGPGLVAGETDGAAWDLRWEDDGNTLYTFPQKVWERELLPAAQIVLAPTARFTGTVNLPAAGAIHQGIDAVGGLAHIYGQGNALRWGWLHADLGGGDVLEVVTASSKKPVLNRVAPIAFVRFRIDGEDWPAAGMPALRMKSHLGLPTWSVSGLVGRRRVKIRVHQPAQRCVSLRYEDPDGEMATCTNTERADLEVVIERRSGGKWQTERRWDVCGTAHAEIGTRP